VNTLDALLGGDEPHATFHDARIESLNYDPLSRLAHVTASLCVGDPTAASKAERERRRSGILDVQGVSHWRQEQKGAKPPDGFWLVDEGPLAEAPTEFAKQLLHELRDRRLGWYLYFGDTNSYIYWIADAVHFRWLDSGAPAA
jgi:hypothetical protein